MKSENTENKFGIMIADAKEKVKSNFTVTVEILFENRYNRDIIYWEITEMQNKQYFLDFLAGRGTMNVLFEPYILRQHIETLIWRRGTHLWDHPAAYVDTLLALSERTRADVIFGDMRDYTNPEKEVLLCAADNYSGSDDIGFAVICDNEDDLKMAEKHPSVCAAAVYGTAVSASLPVVRMDGTLQAAIARGDAGWFAKEHAEQYLQESAGKIRILGGLGREFVLSGSPVGIYAEVERLARTYPGQWACGSGFEIPEENYLELISVLGAFGRIH